MRAMLVLAVAIVSAMGGDAQARREFPAIAQNNGPRVDRVIIIEKGIYRARPRATRQNENSPTGGVRALGDVSLVQDTDVIQPKLGMHFGIRYVVRGFPAGARLPIHIVQRYPIAGLTNPRTKKTTYTYQQTAFKTVGFPAFEGYHLGSAWELVPGIWSFEIWHNGRMLAQQKFELVAK